MKTLHITGYCGLLLVGLLSAAGVVAQQVPGFQVLSRQPLAADKGGRMALSAGTQVVTIKD